MRDELASLHERANAARQAAEDVRGAARQIVARCVDGRIRRENDWSSSVGPVRRLGEVGPEDVGGQS